MNYKIFHLGAEHSVSGSCHLLQTAGLNIMVDCGSTQGQDSSRSIESWPVQPNEIDYIFITHAHIDHTGKIPDLIEKGFQGEIICTIPTKELLIPMLNDAMGFSARRSHEIFQLCRNIDDLSWGFEYNQQFSLKHGVRFKFGNAGHILGSCFIRFESENPCWSIIFSGDIGARETPLLSDPDMADSCDLLILESTYGDRFHEDKKDRIRRLGEILERAVSDKGKVFIPSFALGRTQELLYEMDRLFSDSVLKRAFPKLHQTCRIPVFLDSPLGLEVTNIYNRLFDFWDQESRQIRHSGNPLIDFDHLYAVENYKDHLRILDIAGPAIIIGGSGMCSGGRIVEHLEKGLEDSKNDIFFVGYQGKQTPGRDIIENSRKPGGYVSLNQRKIKIHAEVHCLTGYSAHADQKGLVEWVNSMPEKPKKIKLVHGEFEAQSLLATALKSQGYKVI